MKNGKASGWEINRNFYSMASTNGVDAEITMYGEIVEEVPRDWWGDPIDGDFITQSDFLADLERVSGCKTVTIRMNSLGGDAGVSLLIHNRLRELSASGTHTVCIVDGVAMSGGSLIMCACDEVRVNPASLVMIHKCWSILWGGYNADELRQAADHQDVVDRAQAAVYTRKTGLSETQILHMMGDTTYMTGKEAVEKHFADSLIEDAKPLEIAASADGRRLFVEGREFHLCPGMFAPDTVPTREEKPEAGDGGEGASASAAAAEPVTHNDPAATAETSAAPLDTPISQPGAPGANEGGVAVMTLEELRAQYPELVAEAERNAALQATQNERQRLAEIDAIAGTIGNAEMVREARYGESACDARELAYRAARASAERGSQFLGAMNTDVNASGAAAVAAAVSPDENKAPKDKEKTAALIKETLGKGDE